MIRQVDSVVGHAAAGPRDTTFDPPILADDLQDVRHVYARLFATLDTSTWDGTAQRGRREWTLHETIAHLCALNGAGLESITHTLHGEPYIFRGLESRYQFNTWNREGIEERLGMPPDALCGEFLRIHEEAADIARNLRPGQEEIAAAMPVYNRPVRITEALSIMIMHAGLIHAAQVAEPLGVPPIWMQLPLDVRHRLVGRMMRAFSLLYRHDIGGSLRAVIAFRVDGPGGGEWFVDISPEAVSSGEGQVASSRLVLRFSETGDFCRMLTGRFNLPLALIGGKLKLRGDLRLFLRMNKLFSVDARP